LRRDGPHNISQKFRTEAGGGLQIAKFDFDLNVALFAFHLRFAARGRKQRRSPKINSGGATSMLVVDRFCGPVYHIDRDGVDRLLVMLLNLSRATWRGGDH